MICRFLFILVATFHFIAEAPANEPAESLDLTYIHGGDYQLGNPLSEDEIIKEISSNSNIQELNLTGQQLSSEILYSIHHHSPLLKKLTIRGTVRFNDGDGLAYSWESINEQVVSSEMLLCLLSYNSPIEILDLSLTTVDNSGLEHISQSATNLREIYLTGAINVSDAGIKFLVDNLPNLKLIDISKYILRQPMGGQETIESEVSQDLIKELSQRGIIIIQNDRTPWF